MSSTAGSPAAGTNGGGSRTIMKEMHIQDIQAKLRVWVALNKQCNSMAPLLRLARAQHSEQGGLNPSAIEASFQVLRTKADAALEEASEALRTRHRG
jgi:hypothetical protein